MNTFNPFANAPVLPFDLARQWLAQGRSVLANHGAVVLLAAAVVMLARWQLDFLDGAAVIVLSYFTDALVFCIVFAGLQAAAHGQGSRVLADGYRALRSRWGSALRCSLWGLPAAAASHVIFRFSPEIIKAMMVAVGVNMLGVAALLLLILVGGYITFLLSLLPVLAAIHAVRDPHATFKVAGLWAFRGIRAGWRPLLTVFMAFITWCFVAGALLTAAFGHLPVDWMKAHPQVVEWLGYWYPWPGLLLAMVVFVSILYPMGHDLLQAADVDLSDEIYQHSEKGLHGDHFVAQVLGRMAWALRSMAVLCLLFSLLYGSFFGGEPFATWMMIAVALYLLNLLPAWLARRYLRSAGRAAAS